MKIYLKQTFIGAANYRRLETNYPTIVFTKTMDSDVDIAIVSPNFVKKNNIDKMPQLKWIQLLTVGYDSADTTCLNEKNIILTNVKDVLSMTIAEDIITKILVLNRNVKKYVNQMSLGNWQTHSDEQEIFGSTVGFIGAGSLSTSAAVRLKAFDAKVICYRKSQTKHPLFDETYHDLQGLKVLLNQSDYVVVTLPLNEKTHHFMNISRFKMMKKDALLINVGRGEVVDQDALIDALEKGLIRGAGLDVTTPEPLPKDSKLWQMENVYITPHNAPSSPYMIPRLMSFVEDNIDRYIQNKELKNIVSL